MLSKEGKAMRWLACTMPPGQYVKNLEDKDCSWPDTRTFFQLWSGCEDLMLAAMVGCAMDRQPQHMSLHFDGLRVAKQAVHEVDTLITDMEDAVFRAMGFRVKLV